jgi:hypothetical protein
MTMRINLLTGAVAMALTSLLQRNLQPLPTRLPAIPEPRPTRRWASSSRLRDPSFATCG